MFGRDKSCGLQLVENMMKRCLAVVNLLFEVAGLEAPTKGKILKGKVAF